MAKWRWTTSVANTVKTFLYTQRIDTKAIYSKDRHKGNNKMGQVTWGWCQTGIPPVVSTVTQGCNSDYIRACYWYTVAMFSLQPWWITWYPENSQAKWSCGTQLSIQCSWKAIHSAKGSRGFENLPVQGSETQDGHSLADLELSRKHNYFYQVQGQMAITVSIMVWFCTLDTKGMSVQQIPFNRDFVSV